MLAVRLPSDIEKRLNKLAKATGRTKTFYVREILVQHIDELEDQYLAIQRLEEPGKQYSLDEVEKELDLDD